MRHVDQDRLLAFAAGRADAREAESLFEHLDACEACADRYQALQRIREDFGAEFLTAEGELDRPKLRRHVFADDAARRALERITHPAIRERLASQGAVPGGGSSAEFAALIASETAKWAKVVKASGAKVD